MKVLLDTTYLLPIVGVDIDLSEELFEKLFLSKHSFIINELSLFDSKNIQQVILLTLLLLNMRYGV